jgi:Holliday junction resolvasome RuvABC DNA-binding subunit
MQLDKDKIDFQVTTSIDEETGVIVQDTVQMQGDEVVNHIQHVINTQDEQVRQALIALGWTPPETKLVLSAINEKAHEEIKQALKVPSALL